MKKARDKSVKKRKVLVTGGAGMVGLAVKKEFKDLEVVVSDLVEGNGVVKLDVGEPREVEELLNKLKPDWVVHLAAITDLEFCEKYPEKANRVNALGSGYLAKTVNTLEGKMVYVSTANVFGGGKKYYKESDKVGPLNVYGQSKLKGEELVQSYLKEAAIVRAGWMVGAELESDIKFVGKMVELIKNGRKKLKVVDDKFGTLTFSNILAKEIRMILENDLSGVFHSSCEELVSRFEIAKEIVKILGVDVKVVPVSSDYFEREYFVNRLKYEGLVSEKDDNKLQKLMVDWREGLREYLDM